MDKINPFLFGALLFTLGSIFYLAAMRSVSTEKIVTKEVVKEIYVSDRLKECESKGGKYGLLFSDFDNKYFEICKTQSTNIDF